MRILKFRCTCLSGVNLTKHFSTLDLVTQYQSCIWISSIMYASSSGSLFWHRLTSLQDGIVHPLLPFELHHRMSNILLRQTLSVLSPERTNILSKEIFFNVPKIDTGSEEICWLFFFNIKTALTFKAKYLSTSHFRI